MPEALWRYRAPTVRLFFQVCMDERALFTSNTQITMALPTIRIALRLGSRGSGRMVADAEATSVQDFQRQTQILRCALDNSAWSARTSRGPRLRATRGLFRN